MTGAWGAIKSTPHGQWLQRPGRTALLMYTNHMSQCFAHIELLEENLVVNYFPASWQWFVDEPVELIQHLALALSRVHQTHTAIV